MSGILPLRPRQKSQKSSPGTPKPSIGLLPGSPSVTRVLESTMKSGRSKRKQNESKQREHQSASTDLDVDGYCNKKKNSM
mmetsp:Transcript_4056/g.7807  ORF Transcript_4056/g.7807 Transcript_4056/m.7807 type:complete len:80 (-) Transcript_4056:48-287(-)